MNYAEQGAQDSGCDSDYKAKLKPQQPLDNKSYPSASRIATQRVIETNRASKQTMMPNTLALPAATEPVQGPVQANNQTTDNSVLPEATNDVGALTIPSANCERSFRHPGDLAAHARSHGKPYNCAHCSYSNTDIRNLRSHMRVHSREAPFTCKMCGQKFVHSNQFIRHKPKCAKNPLKQEN